jgi:hypothetical protein
VLLKSHHHCNGRKIKKEKLPKNLFLQLILETKYLINAFKTSINHLPNQNTPKSLKKQKSIE